MRRKLAALEEWSAKAGCLGGTGSVEVPDISLIAVLGFCKLIFIYITFRNTLVTSF